MTQIAALSGVDKAFGDRLVLSIDSLTLETGQVVALIGPNVPARQHCSASLVGYGYQPKAHFP